MLGILILQKNIQKEVEKLIKMLLKYDGIKFPVQEKYFSKIEVKNNICINVFSYEDELVFPVCVSDQKCEDSMDLLLLIDDDKSHYVYIKDFYRFSFTKQKIKTKIGSGKAVCSVLVAKICWQNIRKIV